MESVSFQQINASIKSLFYICQYEKAQQELHSVQNKTITLLSAVCFLGNTSYITAQRSHACHAGTIPAICSFSGSTSMCLMCLICVYSLVAIGTECGASQSRLSSLAHSGGSPQISSHSAAVQPQDHLRGTQGH